MAATRLSRDAVAVQLGRAGIGPEQLVGLDRAARPDRGLDRARLDDRDADPPGPELEPQRIGDRLERVLRRGVGPRKGSALLPAIEPTKTIRPRRGAAQAGRLRHRDLADEVDLEPMPELVERDELERHRDRDAGVVHERVELVDTFGQRLDVGGIGHVEQHFVPSGASPAGARPRAPASPSARAGGAGLADSRGSAGDQRRPGQSSSQAAILARCLRG